MRAWMKRLAAVFCVLLFMSAAFAADMTAKDVVKLKKLGFSDAEIRTEVEKSGRSIRFTDADLQELKAAGAGDELIQALKAMGPRSLTVQAIVEMVKSGKSVDQILDAMAATPTQYNLKPADALSLTQQDVPAPVLLAMKGAPLGVSELKLLVEGKTAAPIYGKLAGIVGIAAADLQPADALALVQGGVPDEVVAGLKHGRAAISAAPTDTGDLREYRQIGHYFTMRHPANWNLVREIQDGAVIYCFTPESGKTKVKEADVNVSVQLMATDPTSPISGKNAVAVLKHLLPLVRANEPGLLPQGEIVPAKLGQMPAARLSFRGTPKEKNEVFTGELYVALDHGIFYVVTDAAPESRYPAFKEVFHQMLDRSDFGPIAPSHRGPNQEPSEIIARYKPSVVCVLADLGNGHLSSGTGFIVQKNGYIATNAHVAVDLGNGGKMAIKYTALFDSDTGLKDLPLTYIGHRFHLSGLNYYHGVDVALFKLPPGEYAALPLTPTSDVQLGDPIVTMGFPHYFDFDRKKPSLFTTTGIVTRFNKAVDNSIVSIFMDAKITHGNSGGPCLSRVTGGVIGLNTFGQDIQTATKDPHANDLVGYNGLVPMDVLMNEFPLETELGMDPDSDAIDYYDAYSLAVGYMGRGRHRASVEVARMAVKLQPKSADSYCLLGTCLLRAALNTGPEICNFKATVADAETALKQALDYDPNHLQTLLTLAAMYMGADDLVSASQFADRAVKAHPENAQTHLEQATVLMTLKQYDEALAAATKSRELAHEVSAEPYIVSGAILYRQGKLDEGKAQFVRGSEIHPSNIMVRLGVGRYYELKNNYEAAVVEYGRVNADIPDNPGVLDAMGRCYQQLKQFNQARDYYVKSLDSSDYLMERPLFEPFLGLGIMDEAGNEVDRAVSIYSRGLLHYGGSPLGGELHRRLGRIFKTANRPGISFSHFCNAASLLADNAEVKKQLDAHELPNLGLDEISWLLTKADYSPFLVADMVEHTPLNFAGSAANDAEVKKLNDLGIVREVFDAILVSNKKWPPQAGGGGGGGGGGQPAAGGKHPQEFVGTWMLRTMTPNGVLQLTTTLSAEGQWATISIIGFAPPKQAHGTWFVDEQGRYVSFNAIDGQTRFSHLSVNGNVLTWEGPAGVIKLVRQR